MTAALGRFHRQTGLTPTCSDAWRAASGQLARGRARAFPSPPVVLRYFGSFRAAWVSLGLEVPRRGAPWAEGEDAYLCRMAGVLSRPEIGRTLGRSSNGVKARLRRVRRRLHPASAPELGASR